MGCEFHVVFFVVMMSPGGRRFQIRVSGTWRAMRIAFVVLFTCVRGVWWYDPYNCYCSHRHYYVECSLC